MAILGISRLSSQPYAAEFGRDHWKIGKKHSKTEIHQCSGLDQWKTCYHFPRKNFTHVWDYIDHWTSQNCSKVEITTCLGLDPWNTLSNIPDRKFPHVWDWIIETLTRTSQIGNSHMFGIGYLKHLVKHPRSELPTCYSQTSSFQAVGDWHLSRFASAPIAASSLRHFSEHRYQRFVYKAQPVSTQLYKKTSNK